MWIITLSKEKKQLGKLYGVNLTKTQQSKGLMETSELRRSHHYLKLTKKSLVILLITHSRLNNYLNKLGTSEDTVGRFYEESSCVWHFGGIRNTIRKAKNQRNLENLSVIGLTTNRLDQTKYKSMLVLPKRRKKCDFRSYLCIREMG